MVCAGRDLLIEFERAQEEAVRHVFAVQAQLHGLPLLQRDLVGAEGEALGGDVDHGHVISANAAGSC